MRPSAPFARFPFSYKARVCAKAREMHIETMCVWLPDTPCPRPIIRPVFADGRLVISTMTVHGIMGPLRQFLTLAKPWQRVVVGVALAVVGALLGIYIVSAIGAVLVLLVAAGWFRRWRGRSAAAPDASEHEAGTGAGSGVPVDAGDD